MSLLLWESWLLIRHLVDRNTGSLEMKECQRPGWARCPHSLSLYPFPKSPLSIITFKSRWAGLDPFIEKSREIQLFSQALEASKSWNQFEPRAPNYQVSPAILN